VTELPPHARKVDAIGPGTRLREWEVVRFVGSGSFGRVFEARRSSWLSDDGNRALKVFDPILSSAARANLVSEFATMREVRHPNLVAGDDAFDLEDGPFRGCVVFVIEMCEGDLASAIPKTAGGLPPADAADVLADVADGLAALHANGRIHGDVKPENILRKGSEWKLGDFGVSGAIQGSYALAAGITVDYRPPEFSQVDEGVRLHRSADIWAVGVTLHVACTGRHPFPGPDPFMRYAASLRGERQLTPGLDPRIRHLVDERCMNPDPRQRATATELAAELREAARQIRLEPFVHPGEAEASEVTRPVVGPPPAPPAPAPAPPTVTSGPPPDPWAGVDVTLPLGSPTAVSPHPPGAWPHVEPIPPVAAVAPAPFPTRDRPAGGTPAPPRARRGPGTIGWPAVPVAILATLAVTWLAALLAAGFREDGDPPTVARAVYLAVSVVALGGIGLLARLRAPVVAPWRGLAALAAAVTFAVVTVVLFAG
jgi:serine/threonine protein kinase